MEQEIISQAETRMGASLEDLKSKLASVRTGRASLAILDGVSLSYYGTPTQLNQVAKLSVPDPTLITAQPFDPSVIADVERAILSADLGLNPSNDGKIVRIPIPPLTEERRKQLVKKVHGLREEAKTAVRQIRRDANEEIKKLEKAGETSEDNARRGLEEIQKRTDKHTELADELAKNKEAELLEV